METQNRKMNRKRGNGKGMGNGCKGKSLEKVTEIIYSPEYIPRSPIYEYILERSYEEG